ncbi:hypothetical protein FB45DRAFT_805837 [Roridomyces roridus]|uniref:F-box domain-containing protein n=1 Tax=Roridomyces roridus TaxID=1738132 RepID=A0AAD7B329_9AGAR|nr:hypothetical protein FB45DRAFT_805837 [Roridomyces roridus]
MPPEILAEIFTSSIPVVSELLDRESFRIEDSPWVWTHICSRWRAVAISTPALWSVIAMDFANYDYPLEAAAAHVERSAMLKIHFYAFKKPWTDTSSQTQMFSYLIEHSLRWEDLCIALKQDLIPLLPSLRNRIPSLRRLWVQVDGDLTEEVAPVVNFLQTAASLVEIGVSRCLSPGSFLPRTNQLTHYYADAPWDVHQEILRLSSSLVTAHVNLFPEPPDWSTLACEVVELPQLRCLFISHIEALAYFKTPLLGQITLDLFPDECDFPPAFERFLANSSSTLRRLGLRGMPDLILTGKILRACADLSELAIIIHPVTDTLAYETSSALIRLLIPTQDSGILPRLSRIHVAFEGALSLDHELYAQMLESRWNMRPRVLQAATVCFQHEPNLSSIAHLQLGALRCGGLDFTLTKVGNAQEYMAHWLCRPGWIG